MRGEVEESIQIYQSCLEKQIKILGENHYHTLLTKNALEKALKYSQEESDDWIAMLHLLWSGWNPQSIEPNSQRGMIGVLCVRAVII